MDDGHRRAGSNFRQVRLTLTQESSGLTTYRLHGKDYEEDWNSHTLLLHGTIVHHERLDTLEDAIALLMGLLQSQLLPRE